ncbi:MAG: hypothetical protein DHS20C15_16920 [Planctomycetota bacterium]|nr:MAG: hypothetical protein DHS20C15_16920 [Planctomycetota bacterium]
MSQLTRLTLIFLAGLAFVTSLHGALNLGWFEEHRNELLVGHLPVT